MFTNVKLATKLERVKPAMAWQRDNQSCRARTGETRGVQEGMPVRYINHSNRPVRTRMPGGVAGARLTIAAPYADFPGHEASIRLLELHASVPILRKAGRHA